MIYARTELEDMPKNCFECKYGMKVDKYWSPKEMKWVKSNNVGWNCVLTMKAMTSTKRNRYCPLVQDWLIEKEK